MKLRSFGVLVTALLVSLSSAHAARDHADIYFGYSRAGADLFASGTPGINGWQAAVHAKFSAFAGIEADVSHYGQSVGAFTQNVTQVMFGPRITVHAMGIGIFGHGLVGVVHDRTALSFFGPASYNAAGYVFGGGADLPLLPVLKVRVTADLLGNSNSPGDASHYRIGAGLAYHF
jgi:hypothetical protein